VVNATGIWTDDLLTNKPDGFPDKIIRPTKGVHVIFKKDDVPINYASGITSHIDGRFFFVISRENFIVIGTTDTDYKDDLNTPVCTKENSDYLLSTVTIKFPSVNVSYDKMVGSYAGIRPLARPKTKPGKDIDESAISRDHQIIKSEDDLVSICGGKLTTFRVMAEDLMRNHILKLAKEKIPDKSFDKKKGIAKKKFLISLERDEWNSNELVKEVIVDGFLDDHQLEHLYQQYGKGKIYSKNKIKYVNLIG
jgi:glycerol-3-phosphate dehydrogenase